MEKTLNDLIPIHPDNIGNKDWVILLEAGTIVGPSPRRIRVARWMQEKKILKKNDMFLHTKYFIVIEGYNPRIHALYLCPQLFRHDTDKLVPLEGEEIGELIARSVEAGAAERCPWYDPMERLPQEPLFDSAMEPSASGRCWAGLASRPKLLDSRTRLQMNQEQSPPP
jgi:hypothetical protein